MPPWSEPNGYALFTQGVPGAHEIVDACNLVIDMLNARERGRKEGDPVMYLVDSQQRCRSDPVAHARIAQFRPEDLVTSGITGAQADVAEAGDSGVA